MIIVIDLYLKSIVLYMHWNFYRRILNTLKLIFDSLWTNVVNVFQYNKIQNSQTKNSKQKHAFRFITTR